MFPYDEDPLPDYVPTSDEVKALALYAERHGDNWKEDLALDWFHGRDANALPDPYGPALRCVRNRGGERWLASYIPGSTSTELRDLCIAAIDAACVSRGKRKGMLLASCPRSNTDGAAAWQAIMGYANPYKLGIGVIMFMSDSQRAIYNAIDKSLDGVDVRGMDRDRLQLELLGVW